MVEYDSTYEMIVTGQTDQEIKEGIELSEAS